MRKVLAALIVAGLAVLGGSTASAASYTDEFRACVRYEYTAWRADVEAFMLQHPEFDEAGEIARKGYPTSYEDALTHPRIGEVCGPEGSRR